MINAKPAEQNYFSDPNLCLLFKVSANTGNGARGGVDGAATVVISNIRPDKTGAPKVFRSGETIDPTEKMDKR